MKPFAVRSHEDMKPVLMSPNESGPEIHYYMIRGGSDKTNVTVWENGTVGTEYIKSFGHYHVGNLEETYTVLEGEAIVILQERETDAAGMPIDDQIRSFRAVRVRAGQSIHIPKNTGHLAINIGLRWLVTSDDSPVNFAEVNPVSMPGHADYEPFRKLRGAAYYVVRENKTEAVKDGTTSTPKLVKNPLYKKMPEAEIESL